jgi:hypothetical protein
MVRMIKSAGVSLILGLLLLLTPITLQNKEFEMVDKIQLRDLIRLVLKDMEPLVPYSETAVELLMLTAAVESNLGTYIRQKGGPAQGIFQMEPATEKDLWVNYLEYKKGLRDKVRGYRAMSPLKDELVWNTAYAIAMTRVHYLRAPSQLPPNTKEELAAYWKKVYNTHLGKGTVEKAIQKYESMAML